VRGVGILGEGLGRMGFPGLLGWGVSVRIWVWLGGNVEKWGFDEFDFE
jgi:hypothetical protein